MRSSRAPGPRRAFTIIELIVTIAAIALLLGLLVPTLSRVRSAATATQCASRLAQLSVATTVYSNIYDGFYPPALLYKYSSAGLTTIAWDFTQHPDGSTSPGSLWQFTANPGEVLQDPAYSGPSTFGSEPFTGFNYNTTYIGAEGRFPELSAEGAILDGWDVARPGLPPGQFRRPSTTALFGEGGWLGGANKFMRAPLNTIEGDLSLVYGGGQAFRHGGTTYVAYLDGHVAGTDRLHMGQLATQALLDQIMGYPDNAFLSNDDAAYDPR